MPFGLDGIPVPSQKVGVPCRHSRLHDFPGPSLSLRVAGGETIQSHDQDGNEAPRRDLKIEEARSIAASHVLHVQLHRLGHFTQVLGGLAQSAQEKPGQKRR